ncbi:chromate resistance protein ChrB domain-containing protein [Pelomonas aquatica]|uniref:Chromate resistance protein n=1 Tax=Pelomonas aquatica TaxID=431058 RepID=A0A9X4R457_9BURK|nr:chromate resistance protein ChrB domain-containing protein [Pelomonas aquatica]MCY4756014.1 chromate resistance protein [Pelomonas aquatica]MDG0862887.1 chromate resistance protein [Pelomonas aquatica]
MKLLLLILSLPTRNATARMRSWRALKASGAAVLRDGVHLLPDMPAQQQALAGIADELRRSGGSAHLLRTDAAEDFAPLFERGVAFAALLDEIAAGRRLLNEAQALEAQRLARKLRRSFEQLAAIDFFPGEAQRQAREALDEFERLARLALAPDEPHAAERPIARLDRGDYRGRIWATRERPWVDRLASAWLIRRFIDPEARFLWLKSAADCPKKALGFDFDGASFSHVGARVTFETLLASFDLETPALLRLGLLVHGLDVGGVLPPEAAGVERVLAGMRAAIADDDQLHLASAGVFEGLLTAFQTAEDAP